MKTFADLDLIEPLCRALQTVKYETPSEIQTATIPHLLMGGDLLACAQTGTGKTASFALPILQHLAAIGNPPRSKEVRALILTPTRELAVQVAESCKVYGQFLKLRCATVYGGVGYGPQIKALKQGVDILVATPGRLIDLMNGKHLRLSSAQFFVLDEADRMLDMGFKKDLERIRGELPKTRQTILFSATMPAEIESFARNTLENPKHVNVSPKTMTAHNIDEKVIFVQPENKHALLVDMLADHSIERAIVFTRTKHHADRLSKKLKNDNVRAEAIHGDKSQNARQKSLLRFREGRAQVLVATDVAARGIDVDNVTHVFNYQLSNEAENYVHRIGRTARAGKSGVAITFCDGEEGKFLRGVERLLKRTIAVEETSQFYDKSIAERYSRSTSSGKKRGPLTVDGQRRRSRGRKRRPSRG